MESSPDGQSFLSFSDALSQYWDRPLDLESIQSRLLKSAKICLSAEERIERLAEPLKLAKERSNICQERIEQLNNQY